MTFQPHGAREGDAVVIYLLPPPYQRIAQFVGVADVDDFGDVIGVEILDFDKQVGALSLSPSESGVIPRWSYDGEVDAFYVRLSDGTASCQTSVVGAAVLDDRDRLAQLRIPRA